MATAPDLFARLRALPAAAPLLAAFGGRGDVRVVGGTVRDLLLDGAGAADPLDVDVVVGDEVEAAAERLAGVLGPEAEVERHERFGTVTVRGAGHAYDLVRARAESYARPGALPDVRPGSFEEDLARRDFTVNAIAVGLDGRLHAVEHALDDLAAGRLRVLHDASFTEDPTRLLRLVRYATRLGFAVEPRTARLAEEAVATGALATVSPARIGAELRRLLREPGATEALARVAAWGAAMPGGAPAIPPGLAVDAALDERALALLAADGREDLLLLALAARGLARRDLARWLDALGFPAGDRDAVLAAATRAPAVAEALAAAGGRPSAIAEALRGARPELAALAGALGGPPAAAAAARWRDELRHVALAIDGEDLLAAGIPRGAAIGRGLEAARRAKLDGEADGRAAQLAAALAAAGGR